MIALFLVARLLKAHQVAAVVRRFQPLSSSRKSRESENRDSRPLGAAVVLAGERVSNPSFYGELMKMGFEAGSLPDFAEMAEITFVDTVVSHEPFTNGVLFHELVHVVQYEKLGLMEFAAT